jgi:hypothetical protein
LTSEKIAFIIKVSSQDTRRKTVAAVIKKGWFGL